MPTAMMLPPHTCQFCHIQFPGAAERCPHCAQPGLFANVAAAEQDAERASLTARYEASKSDAAARGAIGAVDEFEATLANSRAVIARDLNEVQRLANSDREVYATYYELTGADIRVPEGNKWDVYRVATDQALFPGYKERIRFAALTLDGAGLTNYGNYSLVLKDSMISHRTSIFESNSVLWMLRRDILYRELPEIEPGYRASWCDRARLAVAKLACKIRPDTSVSDFPGLVLAQGATSADDEYVEVHVWGPITVRTVERVIATPVRGRRRAAIARALRDRLSSFGVDTEVRV